MAYAPDNLILAFGKLEEPRVPRLWFLLGTDAIGTVNTTGYISDARLRGVRAGDIVLYFKTDSSPRISYLCNVNSIESDGTADLSDGLAITDTDSD